MDFITQQLLRQQEAFLGLFSKEKQPRAEAPEEPETSAEPVWEEVREALAQRSRDQAETVLRQLERRTAQRGEANGRLPSEAADGWNSGTARADSPERGYPSGGSAGESIPWARELSRCVERDARRYDGGFALY